ncbi:MAG: NPCBM/NEW2 domain-containing protein, partial [bacterium]
MFSLLIFVFLSAICLTAKPVEREFLSDNPDKIISFSQGWGELGFDVSAHAPYQTPLPLQIKEKRYEKGLGHHANGEIIVALNGKYLHFEAEVGVQWQGGQNVGSVVFQIFVDGKKRFDSGVRRELDPPLPVRVYLRGAKELKLVAMDAGDGITCDCADWANACLIPDPSAKQRIRRQEKMDIAPFARVVFSDPKRMDGCRCSRTDEFPQEDLFLEKEIPPSPEGYVVPKGENGEACIGLVWFERRRLNELILELATTLSTPDLADIKLQAWQGESHWQGGWVPIKADISKEGAFLRFKINLQGQTTLALYGTEKIRWIFPISDKPILIKRIKAFTDTPWEEGEFVLKLEHPKYGKGEIEVYNGEILQDGKAVYRTNWDLGKEMHLKLRYFHPLPSKADRTIVWLKLPNFSFGIAVEDILENSCVYVEDFGVFASTYPPKFSLEEYKEKIKGEKSILEKVREMPDQSFSQAMARVHRKVQDNGPTMISLACDNNKFVVPREGGVIYGAFEARASFGSGGNANIKRKLDGGWFPIPVSQIEEKGMVYRQRSFVAPYDAEGNETRNPPYWFNKKPLFVAEIEAINVGEKRKVGEISLAFLADREKNIPAHLERKEKGIAIFSGNKLTAFLEIADVAIRGNEVHIGWELSPGERRKCFLYIPAWEVGKEEGESLALSERFDLLLGETKGYWMRVLSKGMRIEIPDEFLSNVIKASQVHCLIAARNEEEGKRIAPWIASMSYGPLESEAHSIIYGMDLFGHSEFAGRGLDFFINRYNEKGYLTTGYTVVGTGWHLWTLARHYKLTRNKEWLKERKDKVAKVCKWIIKQREKTKVKDYKGEPLPEFGLMPPGVAADWNRFAYRFFNQAHYYAGLAEMAEALQDISFPEAESFSKEAVEFRQDILRAYRWNQARMPVLSLSNGKWVPAYPGMLYCFGKVGEMYPGEDGNRSWAGDVEIGAHYLIP